jgi:peptidoglycan/xylan/chitin deacetylase (PgdA/CDA1 family)
MIKNIKFICREIFKNMVFTVLGNEPFLRLRLKKINKSGLTTILNLHRVAPDDGSTYRPLDPGIFDELLCFIKREFSVVTFSELSEKTSKPKLVLSFDDGYHDFVQYAVPILTKRGLRVNQNIIPKCVESGLPPLNILAQDFVGNAPKEIVSRLQIEGFNSAFDHGFGRRLSNFLKMRSQAEQDHIASYLIPQFLNWDKFTPTRMMSLDEIKGLKSHEIGAHSYFHSSMEFESNDFLDNDIKNCKAFFNEKIGIPMKVYAFPNGSFRPEQVQQALGNGIDHVLLVGESFNRSLNTHSRFTLDGRTKSEIRFKALGGFATL